MDDKHKIKNRLKADIIVSVKKEAKGKKAKVGKSESVGSKKLIDKINEKIKRRVRAMKQGPDTHSVKDNRLELLFTIVPRSKAEYYVDLLHSFDVNMQVVLLGQGTAAENTVTLFGLGDTDKAVILSVIKQKNIKPALEELEEKFEKIRNGKGIAYTIPLDGVIGSLIYRFLSDSRMSVKDNSGKGSTKV
ncbi:MAG: hypothetical protein J1G04_02040 [Clostridiales bacterium]|nr:hypothetical protein [Clostridiales bacterium]